MSPSSERGSVLILVALSMVCLLSVAALSVDASFAFDLKNRLGAVADAAAKSAAFEVKHKNAANLGVFAQAEVARAISAGLVPSGTALVAARLCSDVGATCSAPYVGTGYVEVIVEKAQPTFFGTIMGFTSLTPRARAVAGIATPEACLTSMHDLTMWTATITGTGCNVRVGGDLHGKTPPATINGSVMVSGHCDGTACTNGNFHNLTEEQPYPDNPFASLTALTPGACTAMPAGAITVSAGCYTSIPNQATITFGPGVFFVSGLWDLKNNNEIYATSGSLIYLLGGSQLNAGNNSAIHIVASNSITGYEGIAMAGDATSSMTVNNQFTLDLTGAAALGKTAFTAVNTINIPNTGCNIMVFNDFEIKAGNGQVSGEGCLSLFTGAPYLSVALAE